MLEMCVSASRFRCEALIQSGLMLGKAVADPESQCGSPNAVPPHYSAPAIFVCGLQQNCVVVSSG